MKFDAIENGKCLIENNTFNKKIESRYEQKFYFYKYFSIVLFKKDSILMKWAK